MATFTLTRRSWPWNVAAALATAALLFAAYLSIPADTQKLAGLQITVRGTINAIDPATHIVNISHEPVKELNADKMKMDFRVAPRVDLKTLHVGSKVVFTLSQLDNDLYVIDAIKPTM